MNPIDTARTALLVMDVQNGIVSRLPEPDPLVEQIADTIAAVRAAGGHVGYVRVAFTEEDFAGIPPHSSFAAIAADEAMRSAMHADSASTAIDERVAPQDGDLVVRKTRVGPFSTTDLREQLEARGITTLLLTGISTSGVVLSTVRQAADLDYRVVVILDEVADPVAEVHQILTTAVFPRQAEVVTSAEVAAALG
ncbi:MAG: isochorismatase-family hydrolase [Marmoricola sp.]|nr:isochorismatase-family hydrolase [Marmoricola sp.]